MNKDQITEMARKAGFESNSLGMTYTSGRLPELLERFAELVRTEDRNELAAWMMAQGYATGHGDTMEGLLEELEREIGFDKAELWIKRINDAVLAEREACLNCYSPDDTAQDWVDKIRARGQG
jgi:hypothetical protein